MIATGHSMISLIYARALNHCIGDRGRVPWYLPDDYSHFENTISGKPIIMGRRTYEDHESVLPGCLNIVVSTQQGYQTAEGVALVQSLPDAIDLANEIGDEVFMIGGVGLFTSAFPIASTVYETVVNTVYIGDTVLPKFDFRDWSTELLQYHLIDRRHDFSFRVYRHHR